jgi:tetratricopeptide (TPR) repeat protein
MKKVLLLLAMIVLLALFLLPQEYKGKGRILGIVLDEDDNPIEGATVKLIYPKSREGFSVKTDKEGRWVAAWIRGGLWDLDFEMTGYKPHKITFNVDEWKRNPEIVINLEKVEGLLMTDELRDMLNAGNALFDEKKFDEAIEAYVAITEKFPETYVIHLNIGNAYFAQEKYDLAEKSYLKVIEKDAKNADALLAIGNTYANRGDTEKALEWYGKIEFEKIKDPIVLYNIGTGLYNSGQFKDALKFYQRSVDIQENFLDGLYQLGLAHLNLNHIPDSVAAFEKYLQYDSDSQRAAQVRSFLDYLKKKQP